MGRKLFHVTTGTGIGTGSSDKRVRIWDPLTNVMEFDEPLVERFFSNWSTEGELALLTTGNRLRVFSADATKVIVDTRFEADEVQYLSSVGVFTDEDNVYVNLSRSQVTGASGRSYSLASDSVTPLNNVHRGLLAAFERDSGNPLWKRQVKSRSFLRIDRCSLPFLVGLSKVSPKRNSSLRSLEVQVIDRRTGQELARPQTFIPDRIVHYQTDRDASELQLHGLSSRIDLQFRHRQRRFPLEEQPL